MPRPFKIGLDYFPLDTDFFGNKKIKSLRRAHGEIGILTYLNLLSRVYKNGYFYKFDDLEDLSMDIAEEIACSQLRSVAARVTETINYLVGRETLAEGLFKRGIISGVSLQEQYVISAYKAKRNIKMDVHCLVDVDEVISKFKNNSEETQVNSEETQVNSELSTQSKSNSKSNSKKKLKSLSITTTTTNAGGGLPPSDEEIMKFFEGLYVADPGSEAYKFKVYNESRGWGCLPDWQSAAKLWKMRIQERGGSEIYGGLLAEDF